MFISGRIREGILGSSASLLNKDESPSKGERGRLGRLQWVGSLFRLKSLQPTFVPAVWVAEAPVVG